MKGFSQIAFGIVIGIVTAAMFTPRSAPQPELWPHPAVQYADPLPPQENAPVVDLVPAHEAKAEPATGVPETTEAAQADSGVELKLPDVPPESVPLQDEGGNLARLRAAIESYRDSGGQRAYVENMSDYQHLVRDHHWPASLVDGLTFDERQYLHGASHAGDLNPSEFMAVGSDTRPVLECLVPEGDWCKFCNWWKRRGDSGLPFRLKFVTTDRTPRFGYPTFRVPHIDGREWFIGNTGDSEAAARALVKKWREITGEQTQ